MQRRAGQRHVCDEPHLRIEDVEDAVLDHYRKLTFSTEFLALVRARLADVLDDEQSASRLLQQQLRTELARLDRQEENLLDLAADGELPKGKIKVRLQKIASDRTRIEGRLGDSTEELRAGAQVIEGALRTLEQPSRVYESMGGQGRRTLNQAIFTKLYIYGDAISADELKAPFADLVEDHRAGTVVEIERSDDKASNARGRLTLTCHRPLATRASLLSEALADESSSRGVLVGDEGLEPPTLSV